MVAGSSREGGGIRKATLFQWHSWMGLNLGLLLFIACLSGTVATLSAEIDWLFNPALRAPGATGAPPDWNGWYRAVRTAHPEADIRALSAPAADGWAAAVTIAERGDVLRLVLVHPETAVVQGTVSAFTVARFFRAFHKQFYIYPGALPHGVYVVGPLGLVLFASVVTALLFYRMRWKDALLRQRSRNARTFWSTLHRATGVWAAVFSLLFAVTGVWYLYERIVIDLGLVGGSVIEASGSSGEASAVDIDLDEAARLASREVPGLDVRSIFVRSGNEPRLTLVGQTDAWLVRDAANRVVVDPERLEVLNATHAAEMSLGLRLGHTMDPLHFGNFAGLGVKLLWFVAGLLISVAILIGVRIWSLRTAARRRPAEPGVTMGSLSATLVVLAVTAYGCVVNIGSSVSTAAGASLVPVYVWLVVGGFFVVTLATTLWWHLALLGRSGTPVSIESH